MFSPKFVTAKPEARIRTPALLFGLPFFLVISTAVVFRSLSVWFGKERGYLFGFLFYWGFWCLLIPFMVLGKSAFLALFRNESPLFTKENWLVVALLLLITIGALVMYPVGNLFSSPNLLIIIAIPVALLNGICEETFWRGLYLKVFPDSVSKGVVYPSIGFALWHISPQLVFPSETGIIPFVISTFFLGLSYGWIAYRTRTIRWTSLSHSLNGILALGGYLAPGVLILLTL